MLQEARNVDAIVFTKSGKNSTDFLRADQEQLQQHKVGGMLTNELQNYKEGYEIYGPHPSLFTSYAELLNHMTIQIGHTNNGKVLDPWRPIIPEHNATEDLWKTLSEMNDKNASFAILGIRYNEDDQDAKKDFYFSLYRAIHSFNIGHLLWDDLLTNFAQYDRLVAGSESDSSHHKDLIIPFFVELANNKKRKNYGGNDPLWRCSLTNHQKWVNCVKMYKRVYAAFTGIAADQCSGDLLRTGNWLHGDEAIGIWPYKPKNDSCLELDSKQREDHLNRNRLVGSDGGDTNAKFVMIRNVLAGGGRSGTFACNKDCSLGRGREYYRFRNYLFQNILLYTGRKKYDAESKKRVGHILFSISAYSSRPDQVYNFENEIKESIQRFGEEMVKVVNLATLSMKDQVLLLDKTAVLVTNHGGISSAFIFLPRGSAVLVYWHGKFKKDIMWFNSAGYFRPIFVGVDERLFLNRTMAIIDHQLRQTSIEWQS